jgi:hypothetical protein
MKKLLFSSMEVFETLNLPLTRNKELKTLADIISDVLLMIELEAIGTGQYLILALSIFIHFL